MVPAQTMAQLSRLEPQVSARGVSFTVINGRSLARLSEAESPLLSEPDAADRPVHPREDSYERRERIPIPWGDHYPHDHRSGRYCNHVAQHRRANERAAQWTPDAPDDTRKEPRHEVNDGDSPIRNRRLGD